MRKAYWRCNSGHYYCVRFCPFDGWSRPSLQKLLDTVTEMDSRGEEVSIAKLVEKGFDQSVLDRVIVIEFGGNKHVFDAISPEGYVIQSKYVPLASVGPEFL
jgi:hypothetical protein